MKFERQSPTLAKWRLKRVSFPPWLRCMAAPGPPLSDVAIPGSHFTELLLLLFTGLLFSNGFFKVSRLRLLWGGGRMAGLGWIGLSWVPGIWGPWAGRMGRMFWVEGKALVLIFSLSLEPVLLELFPSLLCSPADCARLMSSVEPFVSCLLPGSSLASWGAITPLLETFLSLLTLLAGITEGAGLIIFSCANVTWYFNALSLVNFFSQWSLLQLIKLMGLPSSVDSVLSSILSLEIFAKLWSVPLCRGFFRFFFFLFFFFLMTLVFWSGASVSADLEKRK